MSPRILLSASLLLGCTRAPAQPFAPPPQPPVADPPVATDPPSTDPPVAVDPPPTDPGLCDGARLDPAATVLASDNPVRLSGHEVVAGGFMMRWVESAGREHAEHRGAASITVLGEPERRTSVAIDSRVTVGADVYCVVMMDPYAKPSTLTLRKLVP